MTSTEHDVQRSSPRRFLVAFGRELLFFFAFFLIAVALTWPLTTQLSSIVSDTGDPLLNAWILDWDCYALTHRGAALFQANIFFPGKYPLAYSENMLGIALLVLPSYLAGLSALTTYNIAMLLGFAFSAYGAFVLGRKATRSVSAGIVAGVLYGFVHFRFDHLAHVQIVWGGWLPMIFAALFHFRERPTLQRAAMLGAALAMNGATNVHWLLFGFFAYGVSVVVIAIAHGAPSGQERAFWTRLAAATFFAVVLLVPLLRPYQVVSKLYNMKRGVDEVRENSAVWTDWLVATDRSAVYGALPAGKFGHPERHLFPGLVALFLTGAAIVLYDRVQRDPLRPLTAAPPVWLLRALDAAAIVLLVFAYIGAVTERFSLRLPGGHVIWLTSASNPMMYLVIILVARLTLRMPARFARFPGERLGDRIRSSRFPLPLWIGFVCIVIGVLGSFGLNAFFHTFLFEKVSAFRSIRAVSRWAAIAYLGLSLASAYGVIAIADRLPRRKGQLASLAILLLALNDVRPNIVWDHAIPTVPAVSRWIGQTTMPGPVIELPIDADSAQYYYLLWATSHHKMVMNGTSGFEPPVHLKLHDLSNEKSIGEEFTATLIRNHCALVIVHGDLLGGQTPKYLVWIQHELQSGRLVFLRRFDHDAEGDWVFALTPNVPAWRNLRAAEVRDAAGFTPSENLNRMLGGEATYNNLNFGRLDVHGSENGGPFRIAGWALSPFSVREVIARFECGKRQIHLARGPRADVLSRWPWYPDANSGFGATIERRPRGVRRRTDLQIEIVDGRGDRTRLPSVAVDW